MQRGNGNCYMESEASVLLFSNLNPPGVVYKPPAVPSGAAPAGPWAHRDYPAGTRVVIFKLSLIGICQGFGIGFFGFLPFGLGHLNLNPGR